MSGAIVVMKNSKLAWAAVALGCVIALVLFCIFVEHSSRRVAEERRAARELRGRHCVNAGGIPIFSKWQDVVLVDCIFPPSLGSAVDRAEVVK